MNESWELHGQLNEISRGYEVGTKMGDLQYVSSSLKPHFDFNLGNPINIGCCILIIFDDATCITQAINTLKISRHYIFGMEARPFFDILKKSYTAGNNFHFV